MDGAGAPSRADELITRRVEDALALVDIGVLDNFVVTGDALASVAGRELL